MSHTIKRKGVNCSSEAWERAAARIEGAEYLGEGVYKQYSQNVAGIGIKLPGYSYPVVVDKETGEVSADTYGGKWGDDALQDKLTQYAATEAVLLEAQNKNYAVAENTLENGDIELSITVGGDYGVAGGNSGNDVAPSGGEL